MRKFDPTVTTGSIECTVKFRIPNTTAALLMPAAIAGVCSDNSALWPDAAISTETKPGQSHHGGLVHTRRASSRPTSGSVIGINSPAQPGLPPFHRTLLTRPPYAWLPTDRHGPTSRG